MKAEINGVVNVKISQVKEGDDSMKTIKQLADENHRSYTRIKDVIQILNIPTQRVRLNKNKAMLWEVVENV